MDRKVRYDQSVKDSHEQVYRYAFRLYQNEQEAEDATQNAYLKLLTHLDRVVPGSECAWLRKDVYFQFLDNYRSQIRNPLTSLDAPTGRGGTLGEFQVDPDPNSDPTQVIELTEQTMALRECIRLLPDHYQAAILHHLRGLSDQEIAAVSYSAAYCGQSKVSSKIETGAMYANQRVLL